MKNIKSLCAVSLMATTMAFTSCTDLTEEPFNILTSDNYFTDKASVEATVLRPYEHAQWCGWDGISSGHRKDATATTTDNGFACTSINGIMI